MVICYRCGKQLCTKQALTYHLNRKNKCNILHSCAFGCGKVFTTQYELKCHERSCNDPVYQYLADSHIVHKCNNNMNIIRSNGCPEKRNKFTRVTMIQLESKLYIQEEKYGYNSC